MALSTTDALYIVLPTLIGVCFISIFLLMVFLAYKIKKRNKTFPLHYMPNLWPFQVLFQNNYKDKEVLMYVKLIRKLLLIFLVLFVLFIILIMST